MNTTKRVCTFPQAPLNINLKSFPEFLFASLLPLDLSSNSFKKICVTGAVNAFHLQDGEEKINKTHGLNRKYKQWNKEILYHEHEYINYTCD